MSKSGSRLVKVAILTLLVLAAGCVLLGISSDAQAKVPEMTTLAISKPTVVVPRSATVTPLPSTTAATSLQTWASQTLGTNISLAEAKGYNSQVVAEYLIPTQQRGIIQANINASRAGYAGKVTNGGYNILLLGGGSSLSNQDLTVQIKNASLGYLQLPATSYPANSEAALAQLLQAFPALSSYNFTAVNSPNNNKFSYNFYAYTIVRDKNTEIPTAVEMGVIKLGNKTWNYALVGNGAFTFQP